MKLLSSLLFVTIAFSGCAVVNGTPKESGIKNEVSRQFGVDASKITVTDFQSGFGNSSYIVNFGKGPYYCEQYHNIAAKTKPDCAPQGAARSGNALTRAAGIK